MDGCPGYVVDDRDRSDASGFWKSIGVWGGGVHKNHVVVGVVVGPRMGGGRHGSGSP